MPINTRSPMLCRAALAAAVAVLGLSGCTDLSENPPSAITPAGFFQNDAQVQSALAGVYSGLRPAEGDYWSISQASSDETVVPTRGTDWGDGGQWIELWTHTYGPNSGAGNQTINGTYSGLSSSIAKANAVLQALGSSTSPAAVQGIAEARVLRAYFYFLLQDAFGGVPIVTQPGLASQPRATRDSVARFVANEIHAARKDLKVSFDASGQGRVTQGAADAILANLYLNWHVYTGTVSATGLTAGPARYDSVIAVTDRILNSSAGYVLAPDSAGWAHNFAFNNQDSKENIFVVRNQALDGLGLDFINRSGHYNQYASPGGWNGFSMIADTYAKFDAADKRRSIIQAGPARALDTGSPIKTRAGDPLVFVPVQSLTAAAENEGFRVFKFGYDPNHVAQNMGNDYTLFRLGGVLLDRAEAYYKLGQQGPALALLNQLRARVYSPPQPLSGTITDAVMLKERLAELTNEGKRRQDMIRLGTFTAPKQFKAATDAGYQILFPIPTNQLQANPLLTQNPGYPN
jgi:starch-binding outer membrane protein, SusD/RagB family